MEPVYYCKEHDTCTTDRVHHRESKVKIPTWQDGDIRIGDLREKGVSEVNIFNMTYQYNCVGVFETCP